MASEGSGYASSSVDSNDECSLPTLDLYIRRGWKNRARALLRRHLGDRDTADVLWEAAETLNWGVLKLFVSVGARIERLRNENRETLLHVIVCHEIIQDQKKRLQEMVLAVEAVAKHPRVQQIINAVNIEKKSPLHIACGLDVKRLKSLKLPYVRLLKLLIDAGADVNLEFKEGIRPLHIAHESQWALECLISRGASVNAVDSFQRPPFVWVMRNPHFPSVQMIPVSAFDRASYRFDSQDYMGNTVVHYAIARSRFARSSADVVHLLERLIHCGADVNAQNRRLQTPFFMLIQKTDLINLAKCLLFNGAKVELCDADGYNVASLAAMMGKIDYLKLLIPRLSHNFSTPTGETVQDLVTYYINEEEMDAELQSLLTKLNAKTKVVTKRTYKKPYSVWEYVQLLLGCREIVSLYIVDTFYRYQGGRSMFSDFFLNISYSSEIRRKAIEFKETLLSWNGHPDQLLKIVDRYSIGSIHDTVEPCHCSREECSIAYEVRRSVEALMSKVRELDSDDRYLLDVIPVGSVVDGTKIFLPDEFDFLIVFEHYPCPQLTSTERMSQITLVEDFRLLLVKAMQETDRLLLEDRESKRPQLEFLFVDCELRRVCLNIRMIWRGAKYPNLHLSVDLTPVIQFDGWDDQHYGLRPLRPFHELPAWYQQACHGTSYFRPVYNYITVPPFTPIAENKVVNLDAGNYGRVCLRLLKMILQTDFLIKDMHTPNSYCLKLALLLWCSSEENVLPDGHGQIAAFVAYIAEKFVGEWAARMPYFVTEGTLTTRFPFLFHELLQVLQRNSHQPAPEY